MPKIVNHNHERKLIAETTWRIIETEGIEKASIRRILESDWMNNLVETSSFIANVKSGH